ncbi:hypothetical protein CS542_06605 [Pedobacter sp. IW39]|nr:hypothetical protein CS542_06605 [Pedobacter sp. IW39]
MGSLLTLVKRYTGQEESYGFTGNYSQAGELKVSEIIIMIVLLIVTITSATEWIRFLDRNIKFIAYTLVQMKHSLQILYIVIAD